MRYTGYYDGPNRIQCPYGYDQAMVNVVWTAGGAGDLTETVAMVELHKITHPALSGACPASLMRLPLSKAARDHMQGFREQDQRRVVEWQEERERQRNIPQNYASNPKGVLHLYCMKYHKPGQPCPGPDNESTPVGKPAVNPTSPGWALGGREDEDVRSQAEDVRGPVPRGVVGHNLGDAVAGADETAAMTNGAIAMIAEAKSMMDLAQAKLSEAGAVMNVAGGQNPGETARSAMQYMRNAQARMIEGEGACNLAIDACQSFIRLQYS